MATLVPSGPDYENDVVLAHHLQMGRQRLPSVQTLDRCCHPRTSVHMPKRPHAKLHQLPSPSPMASIKHLQKRPVPSLLQSQHLSLNHSSRSKSHNNHNIKVNTLHQQPRLPQIYMLLSPKSSITAKRLNVIMLSRRMMRWKWPTLRAGCLPVQAYI